CAVGNSGSWISWSFDVW
nr:immunoglobulin heavy chain junction region [Macaca mulatta]MOX60208.1 immunoglobulin heavy chain junction region [Macaca mulatta]MOX60475.1 immunoglobulin heavy chain junction region [Macaca mulatta]MOX60814.1 immunoglobulin heavy chain junction region [Macaca mulatta]MOX60837.1 immunoglobulin heavy chain junction region [Macaca mulatta]